MGIQSSRIWLSSKDHKEIYLNGKYHDKMYIGSTLVWQKLDFSSYYPANICYNKVNDKYYILANKIKSSEDWPGYGPLLFVSDNASGPFNFLCNLPDDTSILYMFASKDGNSISLWGNRFAEYNISDGSLEVSAYIDNEVLSHNTKAAVDAGIYYIKNATTSAIGSAPHIFRRNATSDKRISVFPTRVDFVNESLGLNIIAQLNFEDFNSWVPTNKAIYYAYASGIKSDSLGEYVPVLNISSFTDAQLQKTRGTTLYNEYGNIGENNWHTLGTGMYKNNFFGIFYNSETVRYILCNVTTKASKELSYDSEYGGEPVFRGYEDDYALLYSANPFKIVRVGDTGTCVFSSPVSEKYINAGSKICAGRNDEIICIQALYAHPVTVAMWRCNSAGGTGELVNGTGNVTFKS